MSEETVQKILEEVDNYEQAINASLSFIHIYKWDEENERPNEKVKFWLGKGYNNGENNLTPDITIQLNGLRGIVEGVEERLIFNTEEFNIDWLTEFIRKLKSNWKTTFVYSIIGELERIKLNLLCLLEEEENDN